MCNDYEQNVAWAAYRAAMKAADLAISDRQSERDLPRAADVRIGDIAPVARQADDLVELQPMQFGMRSSNLRRSAIFNFRSEGRHFTNSRRCLIPASAFFEFSGNRYPKTRHRFSLSTSSVMAIAGIWREGQGNESAAFAMLTIAPGLDVAPIHNRQVVVLRPDDWRAWLELSAPEEELLRPLPAGSLAVELVRQGAPEEPGPI
ncbi:SOS response-associated peptidase family protein [Acidocella sp.]|jgi:putative SOS response-associated peptidase YedK|uniref:SOS response-associated peptidase family protein n=1 Tax=Acidocella sp. TaxID=50710 RepID=UPI002F3EA6B7